MIARWLRWRDVYGDALPARLLLNVTCWWRGHDWRVVLSRGVLNGYVCRRCHDFHRGSM